MGAKTAGFVFSMALPLILARRMDPVELGLYKQAFLVVATAGAVLPLGFGMNAYYFLPRERARRQAVVLNILLFHALVGTLAYLTLSLYPTLLERIFGHSSLAPLASRIGAMVWLSIVASFLDTVAIANGEVKVASAMLIGTTLTRAVLFVSVAVFSGTVESLVSAGIAHSTLVCIVLLVYLRSRFPEFWRAFDKDLLRRQLSYSLPLGAAGLLYVAQTDLHNYVVSNRFGPALYAVYTFGTIQLPFMVLLQESANAVLIPQVAMLEQRGEHREIARLVARAMRKLAALFFPAYAYLLVTGREFLSFLFTDVYRDSWPVFAVNLTMLPVSILILDPLQRAYASERYFLVRLRVLAFFVLAAALWTGTSTLGLTGAILAVVTVAIAERFALAARFMRLTGVRRTDLGLLRDVGKCALAAVAAGGAAATARLLMAGAGSLAVLAVCGAVVALVYLGGVMILKVVTPQEKNQIRRAIAGAVQRAAKPA
jgi:O-antigen/teichoic acid export membrane protein